LSGAAPALSGAEPESPLEPLLLAAVAAAPTIMTINSRPWLSLIVPSSFLETFYASSGAEGELRRARLPPAVAPCASTAQRARVLDAPVEPSAELLRALAFAFAIAVDGRRRR
jgi:hypothetical protein